jgi:hypothetical protein
MAGLQTVPPGLTRQSTFFAMNHSQVRASRAMDGRVKPGHDDFNYQYR